MILFFGFSLAGTILNMLKLKEGFICWAISNVCWCAYMYFQNEMVMAMQFFVYFFLAVWGYIKWAKDE